MNRGPAITVITQSLRAVSGSTLRVCHGPDDTRFVVADGAAADVILTSDRRALRAHLTQMLRDNEPDAQEREQMARTMWRTLLHAFASHGDTEGGQSFSPQAATVIDIMCDGHDDRGWYPHTAQAFADCEFLADLAVEEVLTDTQIDDLRDIGGEFNSAWTLVLTPQGRGH